MGFQNKRTPKNGRVLLLLSVPMFRTLTELRSLRSKKPTVFWPKPLAPKGLLLMMRRRRPSGLPDLS
jgi:hypothetical protein